MSYFPPGVLQMLHGDDFLVPLIADHTGIPKNRFHRVCRTREKDCDYVCSASEARGTWVVTIASINAQYAVLPTNYLQRRQ